MAFDLGEKIKDLRKKNGWSQKKLADKLKVSNATICKYESCAITPTVEMLCALADVFRVSMDELCGMQPKGTVSLAGLSDGQKDIIRELTEDFRSGTVASNKASLEKYALLGRIVDELKK
ncbi:MAG: helix-turn-helix transcriptional regulator [Clostridia bacterium]|nr:helix-turn-helix transcriptional regulator [Clostridia bacterium]